MKKTMRVGQHDVSVSHTEKVFFPQIGFTKGDVIAYYHKIAKIMLPHLQDRPISMQRFPDGITAPGFYEKSVPDYFPDWIDTVQVSVKEDQENQAQVMVNQTATLVYLANQACLTPHIWLSRKGHLNNPDKLIFDLDPPTDKDFAAVREAALLLKKILDEIQLAAFAMTTGSRGIHVTIPLDQQANFGEARDFARLLAEFLVVQAPEAYTTEVRKEKRQGRIFIDYLRNAYAQTSVAPYALRARPLAPVATPLDWNELRNAELTAQTYTVKNIFLRLAQKEDPWKHFFDEVEGVKNASKKLDKLI